MTRDIRLHRWTDLDVTIETVEGRLTYTDPHTGSSADYEYATWTSPEVQLGLAATQIVPSWVARTPAGTWIQVELRCTTVEGGSTRWYVLGRWAEDGSAIRRTTVPDQKDADGDVDADTLKCADGHEATGWQIRITLCRRVGDAATPRLIAAGAVASRVPDVAPAIASKPAATALGRSLPVPQYSQRVHAGQNPEWDGGGGSWCSPTSVSMAAAATLTHRGRAVHRGRDPAGALGVVPGRAGAGRRLRHERAPADGGRLHRGRRPGDERSGGRRQCGRTQGVRPGRTGGGLAQPQRRHRVRDPATAPTVARPPEQPNW